MNGPFAYESIEINKKKIKTTKPLVLTKCQLSSSNARIINEGKRSLGRPNKTLRMPALEQLQTFGIKSRSEAAEMMKDRSTRKKQEMNKLKESSNLSEVSEVICY